MNREEIKNNIYMVEGGRLKPEVAVENISNLFAELEKENEELKKKLEDCYKANEKLVDKSIELDSLKSQIDNAVEIEKKWLCDNCEYLSPKENEQFKSEEHECKATGHILRHFHEHPHINPTIDCPKVLAIDQMKPFIAKLKQKIKDLRSALGREINQNKYLTNQKCEGYDYLQSQLAEKDKEIEELKRLNNTLTNNVFVEDSPALKIMVETCQQQKDKIKSLEEAFKTKQKLIELQMDKINKLKAQLNQVLDGLPEKKKIIDEYGYLGRTRELKRIRNINEYRKEYNELIDQVIRGVTDEEENN